MTELETKIANMPAGKTLGNIGQERTYFVRRTLDGYYEIEAAWVVSEAYDDDHDSYTYHPFKDRNGRPRNAVPWVGRKVRTQDVTEAANCYAEFKAMMASNSYPTRGEVTGSVVR